MARELWLLRHGEAEPHGSAPDADRQLTERGEREARAAGAGLRELRVVPDVIFASPRVRARETARLAGAELGIEPVEHGPLDGGFSAEEARALAHGHDVVLLVGHQPDFSLIVHALTGARTELSTGGIAGIRLDQGGALLALLRPRALRKIGGG